VSAPPAFRATWTKFAVAAVNRSPRREALRKAIGETRLGILRRASVVDWLPIDIHLGVCDAVFEVLGVSGARAFWKERLLAAFLTKTMGPFVTGASVVFGEQPYALMKIAMTSYRLMARNAGQITVSALPDRWVQMDFVQAPAAIVESAGWHALCHGQCQAVLEYLKMEGEIKLAEQRDTSFRYLMRRT
jgi:hypothetical protein